MTDPKRDAARHGSEPKIMHRPTPGPGYWDWRCLDCGLPVSRHASWWRRTRQRISWWWSR